MKSLFGSAAPGMQGLEQALLPGASAQVTPSLELQTYLPWVFITADSRDSRHEERAANACGQRCRFNFSSVLAYQAGEELHPQTRPEHVRPAGLGDRGFAIKRLLAVSESVCARLAFPPPWQALDDDKHNGGRTLQHHWTWRRYFTTPARLITTEELDPSKVDIPSFRIAWPVDHDTDSATKLRAGYTAATQRTAHGKLFRWDAQKNFYQWPLDQDGFPKFDEYPAACTGDAVVQSLGPSQLVLNTAQRVVETLGVAGPHASHYTLHVRRSDTIDDCDTSVPAVVRYMQCAEGRWYQNSTDQLLLFTDETSQTYLQELMRALSKAPRWGGGVVHADPLVAEQLSAGDRDDNFLVYAVASALMKDATHHYTIDRCDERALCEADDPGGLASMTRMRDELQASRMQGAHQLEQQQQQPQQSAPAR